VVSSIRKGKTLSFAKKEVCVPQGRRPWPEMAAVAELLIVYDVKRHHKFFDSIIMVAIKVQF
jgi:hypothetical protein